MTSHLILTHENADFDAVAAQLAAAKLDPEAVPVLSRHVNRNVRDFLTLYGSVLPFVHPDHLSRRRVTQVTVVDSQTYPSVRGMRPDTPVRIIDHHPLTRELEAHQQYTGELVGAATTLLTEQIRQAGISLTPIEATLLMLGIYEDTGSLLYGTTTVRDIAAAAWLLERGADLDIVRNFTTHPLSAQQRGLYKLLLENARAYQVNGFVVLIAAAVVDHMVEEISTLAHKIRDHFEAHAILILVEMPDSVQLVARSAVDNIDVAQVASRFGGGGHGRAAAATIRDWPLNYIKEQLLDMLPDVVTPSAQVAEIMSWGAQTFNADEPIETAAMQMQRTGHEGYPVLEAGRVVGLLQRHAVDRAMSHGLGRRPVGQVMERGNISVQPGDSLETLQQVMMQSGWGQIPVVDERGDVVGIVTRTDLIRRWGQRQPPDGRRHEILKRMHETLPAGLIRLFEAIGAQAGALGVGLYAVGGFVRDLLLGVANLDVDLVAEGDAVSLAQALVRRYGGKLHTHPQFGTAKWLLDARVAAAVGASAAELPSFIDFATARTEFYEAPTALPTVEQRSIKLDLHRRDFTINTLAIRLSPPPLGELLDFYGGERDLRQGVIQVLHSLSFVDDPTRMLRAVRFEQRLGFVIEPRTEALINDALPFLRRLSGDRMRHELDLILQEALPEKALARLAALGLLQAVDERLTVDEWLTAAFTAARQQLADPAWALPAVEQSHIYWIILTCRLDDPASLARRLRFPRALVGRVEEGRRIYLALPDLGADQRPSAITHRLEGLSDEALVAGWAIAPTPLARHHIICYARRWRFVRPTINGNDLLAMGFQRGPLLGQILRDLRDAWLDERITDPSQERDYLTRWIAKGGENLPHDSH